MKAMYTTEAARDRAAAKLARRELVVTVFTVTDGSGTLYGLEYQPKGQRETP